MPDDKDRLTAYFANVEKGHYGSYGVGHSHEVGCFHRAERELGAFSFALFPHLLNELIGVNNDCTEATQLVEEHYHQSDESTAAILPTTDGLFQGSGGCLEICCLLHASVVLPEDVIERFSNSRSFAINFLKMSDSLIVTVFAYTK